MKRLLLTLILAVAAASASAQLDPKVQAFYLAQTDKIERTGSPPILRSIYTRQAPRVAPTTDKIYYFGPDWRPSLVLYESTQGRDNMLLAPAPAKYAIPSQLFDKANQRGMDTFTVTAIEGPDTVVYSNSIEPGSISVPRIRLRQ